LKYLLVENQEIIDNLKRHLYLRSIAEAFSKIIIFGSEDIGEVKYQEERLSLLSDLFEMLTKEQDPDINSNIAFIISHLLTFGA